MLKIGGFSFTLKKERAQKSRIDDIQISNIRLTKKHMDKAITLKDTSIRISEMTNMINQKRSEWQSQNDYQTSYVSKIKNDQDLEFIVDLVAHGLGSTIISVNAKSLVVETKRNFVLSVDEILDAARAYRPALIHIKGIDILSNDLKEIHGDQEKIIQTVKSYNRLIKVAKRIQISEKILMIVSTKKPENMTKKQSFYDAFSQELKIEESLRQIENL